MFFLSPDTHIRAYTALQAMSSKRAKGYWRGPNPDEQIEAALRDGLSEDKSEINTVAIQFIENLMKKPANHDTTKCGIFGKRAP